MDIIGINKGFKIGEAQRCMMEIVIGQLGRGRKSANIYDGWRDEANSNSS